MLGIDIGSSSVKVVAMARGMRGWRCCAWALEAVGGAAQNDLQTVLHNCIRQTLPALPRFQRKLVICLPASDIMLRKISVPADFDDVEICALIAAEAPGWFSLAAADIFFDYILRARKDVSGEREIDLVACPRESLQRRLRLFRDLAVTVDVVDTEAFALLRSCRHAAVAGLRVVLDLGQSALSLHAYDAGELLYSRRFPYTGSLPRQPLAIKERLSQEVRRAMQLFAITAGQALPQQTLLAGGLAGIDGLPRSLAQYCGTDVQVIDGAGNSGMGAELALARGLASRHRIINPDALTGFSGMFR
tara:strand:- start:75460 stop:76371 length:912 start_codon:yes stop_codon:yes gene_type:complete